LDFASFDETVLGRVQSPPKGLWETQAPQGAGRGDARAGARLTRQGGAGRRQERVLRWRASWLYANAGAVPGTRFARWMQRMFHPRAPRVGGPRAGMAHGANASNGSNASAAELLPLDGDLPVSPPPGGGASRGAVPAAVRRVAAEYVARLEAEAEEGSEWELVVDSGAHTAPEGCGEAHDLLCRRRVHVHAGHHLWQDAVRPARARSEIFGTSRIEEPLDPFVR